MRTTFTFLVALLGACGAQPSDHQACAERLEGCSCSPDGACDGALQCFSNVCVDAGGATGPGDGDGDGDGDGPGDDDDDDDDAPADTGDSDGSGSDGQSTAGGEPGGPTIVSLDINVDTIGPGEAFTISAIVTDPDGVDDVIGGQLQSADGETVFATFETQAQEGAYSLVISFEEIGMAQPGAGTSSSESREFRAEFFDQGGAASWETLSYSLECEEGYFCDEQCIEVECIPDLVPCGAGSTCIAGTCFANAGAAVGSSCDAHIDCETYCLQASFCDNALCCAGPWCDPANPSCPAGQACNAFQDSELSTDTCEFPTPGICLPT